MTMIDVQSSNVAAIGYDPDVCVLAVRYRDGHLYVRANVQPDAWAALQAAPSKGKYLATLRGVAIRVQKEGTEKASETSPEQRAAPHAVGGPLNVIDEDADRCCRRGLEETLRNYPDYFGSWICSNCGTSFAQSTVGGVRYWRIVAQFAIVRPQ